MAHVVIPRLIRAAGWCLALAVVALRAESPFTRATEVGRLAAPPHNETSGLAASCRAADLLWTHDDSGGEPVLYAVGTNGALRGKLRIAGVKNVDWEDVASGELDEQPCLVVGDTGDNSETRREVALHLVTEPPTEKLTATGELVAPPLATLRVTYEDTPHDCEAVALDGKERAVYLLTKRDDVPRLYRIALPRPLANAEVHARFVGFVPRLPPPSAIHKMIKGHLGKHSGWPTGMDFTADGSAAVVLTYGDVSWFARRAGETWADALARDPMVLPAHALPQAEAVCFSRDGAHLYVASELSRALLRYDRQ